jgi:hypothetical protein
MLALYCAADAGLGTKPALCQQGGKRGQSLVESGWAQLQALIFKGFFGQLGTPLPFLFEGSRLTLKV